MVSMAAMAVPERKPSKANSELSSAESGPELEEIIRNYATSTTMHTLPRIAETKTYIRAFWSLVFVGCLIVSTVQLKYVVWKYFDYDVSVEQQVYFEPMEFPAVTFCSLNPFVNDKAMEVPQIRNLAAAYESAIERIHEVKKEAELPREKRATGTSDLVEEKCVFDQRFNYYTVHTPNSEGEVIECLCVDDQWGYISYCAPHPKWQIHSCHKNKCASDNYCGPHSDENTFANGEHGVTCVCNTIADGCYAFETIPQVLLDTLTTQRTTELFESTQTFETTQQTTQIFESTTQRSETTQKLAETGTTERLLEETIGVIDNEGNMTASVSAAPVYGNASDYSYVFENITDEMALQAKAKETLVFIGGELDFETKTSISNPFADFIRMCSFAGRQCDMQRDFKMRFDPFYGNCFTFNWNKTTPRMSDRAGAIYGLKVMLYADVETSYLFSSDSPGTRLALHQQDVVPFPEVFGYSAPNGFVSSYAVQLKMLRHMPAPYGKCVNNSKPAHFCGCFRSCYQNEVAKECGCADPRFPAPEGYGFCSSISISERKCLVEASLKFGDISKSETIDCNCSQPCTEYVHSAMFSCSLYPTPKLKLSSCVPMDNATCLKHFKDNSAVIEVYFQQLNYDTLVEVPAYPFANLLSDIGGTVGLWLGASIITCIEFFALGIEIVVYLFQKRTNVAADYEMGTVGALNDL